MTLVVKANSAEPFILVDQSFSINCILFPGCYFLVWQVKVKSELIPCRLLHAVQLSRKEFKTNLSETHHSFWATLRFFPLSDLQTSQMQKTHFSRICHIFLENGIVLCPDAESERALSMESPGRGKNPVQQ